MRRMLAETEALGMCFAEADGVVRQRPAGRPPFRLETVDVSGAPDPLAAAEARIRAELDQPMDPATGDVHRQLLVHTGPESFCWMQGYLHIVTDGVSGTLIARRVAAHYSALMSGEPVPPSGAAPWREIVAEEEACLASDARDADRAFWRGTLPVAQGEPGAKRLVPAEQPLRADRCCAREAWKRAKTGSVDDSVDGSPETTGTTGT
nr:condensation domain-containing protein [Streptomyces sp. SID12488]